ncbi:MAG: phosphoenolpyruvate carboxykinase (ATP) [Magnetococcales bacterium]|nr:phosphoenolpyruvate carboxykinase (ATP) [Magnetococcales bacterium]NGZ27125.1 phosphoenolpyruvate carboxykinase (ATP) [Magnetococcales bacterium]
MGKGKREMDRQLISMGLMQPGKIYCNQSAPFLFEQAIHRGEGRIGHGGVLVVDTGEYTGRSAKDKFIVEEEGSRHHVAWGSVNQPISEKVYDGLRARIMDFLQGRDVYVQECLVGADPLHQRSVRMILTQAWHALFVRNMFISAQEDLAGPADFTVIGVPDFKAEPARDGTHSEAFILLHPGRREVLIGGTSYSGEIKKSIFTLMNYYLPLEGVFPMHASANIGEGGDTAIFFGLSGTGKTTLSTDPHRRMIGDDEHGWSERGVFNFEGGCYAKVIGLSPTAEPEIYACTRRFGTILENVVMDETTRQVDLDNDQRTENTRASYSLSVLSNVEKNGMGGHPSHVIMLTADAFGVLPPVARLTADQAMYYFLSGYTAKLAGTERGVKNPVATFSTCFGEPFMVHNPVVYARMLGKFLQEQNIPCWLVNTGWSGGPFGVGQRMPIAATRTIVNQILANKLNQVAMVTDTMFGLQVPCAIEGVDSQLLNPRATWPNGEDYDDMACKLAAQFVQNFRKYEGQVSAGIRGCQPKG